jgi:hypothetical protein
MAQDYFGAHMNAMDRGYYQQLDTFGSIYHPTALHEQDGGAKTSLGPRELGMSNNPFQHQLLALQAKIREGASSVEFQFAGRGKSSSQASTPESYGHDEREAMRQLAEYNDVRTSTHATFQVSGLAGFGQNGFDRAQQHQVMEEVRRAVDFASQASTGGAIVVHTGEWQRPMSEAEWSKKDFKKDFGDSPAFLAYADEPNKAQMLVVDSKTGRFISGISKDQEIFEPKWVRAADFEKYTGRKLPNKDIYDKPVAHYNPDDFVDADGRRIDPYTTDTDALFKRLPQWNADKTRFDVEKVTWETLKQRADEFNAQHKRDPGFKELTPEELYAKVQIQNQVLQARGNALFHGQNYDHLKEQREKLARALERAEQLDKNLPESEKWKLIRQTNPGVPDLGIAPEYGSVISQLKDSLESNEKQMRHIHESSAAADVQAETMLAQSGRLQSMEDYGLQESGRALGQLGVYALEKNKQMKENVKQKGGDMNKYHDLYIAPENVFPHEYGSHPDELIKIVEAGRKQMAEELKVKYNKSEDEAKALAEKHIKSTLDIGHLNMWKTHMKRKEGETEDQFNKRFEGWAMDKLEEMHKKKVLGHFHITDNLGFNDEHLTPGQGNAPIRSFVQKMEKLGYKDFIIEPGSFNAATAMGESWSYLGMMSFKPGASGSMGQRFSDVHFRHSGGYAPPNYVVGAYVPSNEWTLWSGSPLE